MLKGKAVVITGSGSGIGAACARGVARQGTSVVVNDIDAEATERTVAEIASEGGTATSCVADVSDWEQAGTLIEACIIRIRLCCCPQSSGRNGTPSWSRRPSPCSMSQT